MTSIEKYYDLRLELKNSSYRLEWLKGDVKEAEEYAVELKKYDELRHQLDSVEIDLSECDATADAIRLGLIHITNNILATLKQIESWGSHFPDLNQGMMLPGYLFGSILDDYRTNLLTEGNYYPTATIYMSNIEWPSEKLTNILLETQKDLLSRHFGTKKEAIDYYEHLRNQFGQLVIDLRKLGYI